MTCKTTPLISVSHAWFVIVKAILMLFIKQIIARIVDDSRMHEFKSAYGVSIITGFCHIEGYAFRFFLTVSILIKIFL